MSEEIVIIEGSETATQKLNDWLLELLKSPCLEELEFYIHLFEKTIDGEHEICKTKHHIHHNANNICLQIISLAENEVPIGEQTRFCVKVPKYSKICCFTLKSTEETEEDIEEYELSQKGHQIWEEKTNINDEFFIKSLAWKIDLYTFIVVELYKENEFQKFYSKTLENKNYQNSKIIRQVISEVDKIIDIIKIEVNSQ